MSSTPQAQPPAPQGSIFALVQNSGTLPFRIPAFAALSTFLMGFSIALVLIPAQTMSQQETPPNVVGRVSSTFMSMISIAQVLGLLLSGSLARKLGMQRLFAACAVALVLIAFGGWLWLRSRTQAVTAVA